MNSGAQKRDFPGYRFSNSDGDAHSAIPDGQPQKVVHRNAPSLHTAAANIDLGTQNDVQNPNTVATATVVDVNRLSTRSDQAHLREAKAQLCPILDSSGKRYILKNLQEGKKLDAGEYSFVVLKQ